MPLFYFDVRDGDTFVPDDEGLELPSIDAARSPTATMLPWRRAAKFQGLVGTGDE